MPLVSITRLRLRSVWYLLPFIIHAQRSTTQIVKQSNFLKGKTLLDKHFTFWTMTIWNNISDMRGYTHTAAHKKAMPRLQKWCDEASIVHWEQQDDKFPDWHFAYEKMLSAGRVSKVKYPSPNHEGMQVPPPRYPSRTERILVRKARS
jgi:hypothetical protein